MAELATLAEVATCPCCDSPNLPSSTVCGECGERLTPRRPLMRPVPLDPRYADVVGCTCGHGGVCSLCVLYGYDNGIAL